MCSWVPEELKRMMELQDEDEMGYDGPLSAEWGYNEVVFSSAGSDEWDEDLGDIVQAVFIHVHGTNNAKENARTLHQNVLQHIGRSSDEIPLLVYDPSEESDPFSFLD